MGNLWLVFFLLFLWCVLEIGYEFIISKKLICFFKIDWIVFVLWLFFGGLL